MAIRRPLTLVCFAVVCLLYIFTDKPSPSWDVDAAASRGVSITGRVVDRRLQNGVFRLFLKDVEYNESSSPKDESGGAFPKRSDGIVVDMSDTDDEGMVKLGCRIGARGVFEPFDVPSCEGQFDERMYYAIRGYDGRLTRSRLTGISEGYGAVSQKLRQLRDRAAAVLEDNMDEGDAHLTEAMTLGDKTELDPEIRQLYQIAGISHVLALSGLHIASVGLALLALLNKTGLSYRVSAALSGGIIALYAVMTGFSVSTRRAVIMFAISVAAGLLGRTYDLLSSAALSALMILAADPYYVYDTGFLMSFGALAGISLIYPSLAHIPHTVLPDRNAASQTITGRIAKRFYESVCITVSVTIATLPVTGYSFMQISLLSVAVNLVVIPLMGLVLLTGFAGMIIGMLGIKPRVILKITHYILSFYELLARGSSKIDGNILLIGQPSKTQIITYVLILTIAVFIGNTAKLNNTIANTLKNYVNRTGRHNIKNNNRSRIGKENKITYIIETGHESRRNRYKKAAVSGAFLLLIVAASIILTAHPREDLEIRNVDVGQGDCALIWGDEAPVIMIDGGSSSIKQTGAYRIVPVLKANRIKKIDCCFLTHMDSDHVSGVLEMLEDDLCPVKIEKVIVSDACLRLEGQNENMKRLLEAKRRGRCDVAAISKGDMISCGSLIVTCLSPAEDISAAGFDANDASLVLDIRQESNGFCAVFTGDISENTENDILRHLPDCSYLKVAHHGSRTSSSGGFLSRTMPEICVISVGRNNSYGHPAKETLERLYDAGGRIYRTDESGEIILTVEEGSVHVRCVR